MPKAADTSAVRALGDAGARLTGRPAPYSTLVQFVHPAEHLSQLTGPRVRLLRAVDRHRAARCRDGDPCCGHDVLTFRQSPGETSRERIARACLIDDRNGRP